MFRKERIIKLIEDKGWSKYKLCKEAEITQSTLSDILNGKHDNPTTKTLQKIATALGVSVNDFFDESQEKPITPKNVEEEFDEETRLIARNMKGLSVDKRKLLNDLIKTMSESANEEFKK